MTDPGAPLIECVPNVSEGRDLQVIASLADAIAAVPAVRLLHVDAGVDAHRTVFTFAGPPEAVGDAAIALARRVADLIDMRRHHGAHPRLGALDVCPFVPVRGVSMTRCVALARRVASTLAHDHALPVYLYEAAAFDDSRRSLPALRAGEFEGLHATLRDGGRVPDFGPCRPHPTLGAAIVGARPYLVAWNIALNTADVAVARAIAARVRASGLVVRHGAGAPVRVPGRLPAVRAIGWGMPTYGHAQVSLNLLDLEATPMHVAYAAIADEAAAVGAQVMGSELIGLVPLDALRDVARAGDAHADLEPTDADDVDLVERAVALLGLGYVTPFRPRQRVLEWALADCS
ncbi:MAG: glutamate formimidoyltransferase [Luteitalea sp.]